MPANDTYWYNLKKMHVVFALGAIGLFAVTIGMMWADHSDEWRGYQSTFDLIEEERLTEQIEADKTAEYDARLDDLNAQLEIAIQEFDEDKVEVQTEIEELAYQLDLAEREIRAQRAFRDKARADYDLAIRDEKTAEAERLKEIFDREQAKVNEMELEVERLNTQLSQAKAKQERLREDVTAIESEIAALKKEVERLEAAKEKIAPDSWLAATKREIMQWPIIDGFNSPHQIKQVWLPDLKITLGMASTARFDRCQTCHLGIDRVEAGNIPTFPHSDELIPTNNASKDQVEVWVAANEFPHPYSTHPNPDLYLSSTSPHPTQEFGCTICHDGQGSGTSFDNVQHTPNNPHEHEHWEDKYHYHPNHFWEYPMKPERFRESTCLKCHHSVVELETSPKFGNSAPKVVKGFHTIQQYGCFGCHEIHGQDGAESIGPDLRLEPNHYAVALAIRGASDELLNSDASVENGAKRRLMEIRDRAEQVADSPEDSENARLALHRLVRADKGLAEPLFDSRIHALADDLKDVDNPGQYRKVGPSLRHVAKKTNQGWLEHWTIEPKQFRPSTRMPQFFHLTNQEDELAEAYQPVQVAAISHYLLAKSQPVDLLSPEEGYEPNPERGKQLFAERGCLSCHSHKDFPEIQKDFGPNLDKVYAKVLPGQEGFDWLYSWIRDPHRYNKRTKMPNLFVGPEVPKGTTEKIDAAADIAAYLLQERNGEDGQKSMQYEPYEVASATIEDESVLDSLVNLFLGQSLTKSQMEQLEETHRYPLKREQIKGDEIELYHAGEEAPSDEQWQAMKLNYVGRRTISQYGCYGCHDIPGFESAKPIGAALQDWGVKNTSQLAFEHIQEFLHHHEIPGTDQTLVEQAKNAVKRAKAEEFKSEVEAEEGLSKAFYYDSILHHGRPGFIWQKLRQPRSYDYKKTETKRYDERLRMPKFPFDSDQVEAIATFVLGLTAEPPAERYLYKPEGATHARYEGEAVLHKYNCTSCHMLDLPEVAFSISDDEDLTMTYSDLVGMPRDQIINWFVENRDSLVNGQLEEYPADIQLINDLAKYFNLETDVVGIARLASIDAESDARGSGEESSRRFRENLSAWFANHPELMLTAVPDVTKGKLPEGVRALLKLKPPVMGATNLTTETGDRVLRFHGTGSLFEGEYSYDLWDTLDIDGKILLPTSKMLFNEDQVVDLNNGRGGEFAEWLVNRLSGGNFAEISKARQKSPPPLVLEGLKVQTPWLFEFLKNPDRIRNETVLRMPRFNLSDHEAQTLANYFAAVDDSDYPYQTVPQREPGYAERKNEFYRENFPEEAEAEADYLAHSWKLFGKFQACRQCHSIAGDELQVTDPKQLTHGPNLDTRVASRFRPDYLEVWLHSPQWILPYSAMVGPTGAPLDNYFNKDGAVQVEAIRDALLNYNQLLQNEGKVEPPKPAPADGANGGNP